MNYAKFVIQPNENILGNFLTFEHFSEEKLRLVGNLLDQELMQNQKIVEIEERLYFDFDSGEGDALILKKEFIKEYDLLEDLVMKNKKTIKEVKTENHTGAAAKKLFLHLI